MQRHERLEQDVRVALSDIILYNLKVPKISYQFSGDDDI